MDNLAPYVITTSLRDSMIWESPKGATVQWVAMGDGVLDLPAFFDAFEKKCPGAPVHIETSGGELAALVRAHSQTTSPSPMNSIIPVTLAHENSATSWSRNPKCQTNTRRLNVGAEKRENVVPHLIGEHRTDE